MYAQLPKEIIVNLDRKTQETPVRLSLANYK